MLLLLEPFGDLTRGSLEFFLMVPLKEREGGYWQTAVWRTQSANDQNASFDYEGSFVGVNFFL